MDTPIIATARDEETQKERHGSSNLQYTICQLLLSSRKQICQILLLPINYLVQYVMGNIIYMQYTLMYSLVAFFTSITKLQCIIIFTYMLLLMYVYYMRTSYALVGIHLLHTGFLFIVQLYNKHTHASFVE